MKKHLCKIVLKVFVRLRFPSSAWIGINMMNEVASLAGFNFFLSNAFAMRL